MVRWSTPCRKNTRHLAVLPVRPLCVTLVQNCAGRNIRANLARIRELLDPAPHSDLIALPEVCARRGSDDDYRKFAEPIPGRLTDALATTAERCKAWLLAGSVIERDRRHIFNTSVLFDPAGRIVSTYRKIHLFEAELENGRIIRERDIYESGRKPVMVAIAGWSCGLSICYDIRFPELYRFYSMRGAHLLLVPANFTQRTGRDHWELLVRTRAIENQCFVIAPDQCGANPATGIASHGHSIAVGPWGEVLAQAGDKETILTVRLDPALLAATRRRIPALDHRRLG